MRNLSERSLYIMLNNNLSVFVLTDHKKKVADVANYICLIKIGEIVPHVHLLNLQGELVNLFDVVKQKQTVQFFIGEVGALPVICN